MLARSVEAAGSKHGQSGVGDIGAAGGQADAVSTVEKVEDSFVSLLDRRQLRLAGGRFVQRSQVRGAVVAAEPLFDVAERGKVVSALGHDGPNGRGVSFAASRFQGGQDPTVETVDGQ